MKRIRYKEAWAVPEADAFGIVFYAQGRRFYRVDPPFLQEYKVYDKISVFWYGSGTGA